MFDPTSRYFEIPTGKLSAKDADGARRELLYKKRRFLLPTEALTSLLEHTVRQDERLDNITARYMGDPTQFWLIVDANNVLHPGELTEAPGRVIKIAAALSGAPTRLP